MPELPEVETVVRDLRHLLVGRSFAKITVGRKALRRKWSRKWEGRLLNQRVSAIERRGKWIMIELMPHPLTPNPSPMGGRGATRLPHPLTPGPSPPEYRGRGEGWLLVHLGMTGQFTVAAAELPRETHTHIVFTLDNANELRFRDIRRFGSVAYYPSRAHLDGVFVNNGLGPEPFDLDADSWRASLRCTKRSLKAILLDQTIVAGVGNIYADESLFEARLHPTIQGNAVKAKQAEALRQAIVAVLTRAIDQRGSSIRDYVGGSGLKGSMQDEFRVYGRTGEPCLKCRTPIAKITLAGRSTHFCPKCQRKRV